MKRFICEKRIRSVVIIFILIGFLKINKLQAQVSEFYFNPHPELQKAKYLFFSENYYSCYRILQQELRTLDSFNFFEIHKEEYWYYYIVSGIKMNDTTVLSLGRNLLAKSISDNLKDRLKYFLGVFYFYNNDFNRSFELLSSLTKRHLTNKEISHYKFIIGYLNFTLQNLTVAENNFKVITQLPEDTYFYDANYYLGLILIGQENYWAADSLLKKAKNKKQYSLLIPYYLAQIQFLQNNKMAAKTIALEALKIPEIKNKIQINQLLSQIYFEQNLFDSALPYFQYYLHFYNQASANDYFKLAFCFYKTKKYDSALPYLIKIQSRDNNNQAAILNLLANIYLIKNEKQLAKNALYNCLQIMDDSTSEFLTARLNYIKILMEEQENVFALKQLQSFVNLKLPLSLRKEANELIILLLTKSQNFSLAYSIYKTIDESSAETKKLFGDICLGLGKIKYEKQDIDSAIFYLNQVISNNKIESAIKAEALFWLSQSYFEINNLDSSLVFINEYLKTKNNVNVAEKNQAQYTLAYIYFKQNKFSEALAIFKTLISKNNKDLTHLIISINQRIADCEFMLKNFDKAEQSYNHWLNQQWKNSDYALFQLALISGAKQEIKGKISFLKKLIDLFPKSELKIEAQFELAETYSIIEDFAQAKQVLLSLLELPPNPSITPKLYYKLGVVLYNQNDNSEAINYFDKLYKEYANSEEAENAEIIIKNIYADENQPQKFIDFMSKHGKVLNPTEQETLLLNLAQTKSLENNTAGALEIYKQYLQLPQQANTCEVLNKVQEIYKSFNLEDSAIIFLEKIATNCPQESLETYQKLIQLYTQKHNYEKELKYYKLLFPLENSSQNKTTILLTILNIYVKEPSIDIDWEFLENNIFLEDSNLLINARLYYLQARYLLQTDSLQSDSLINELWTKIVLLKDFNLAPQCAYFIAERLFRKNELDSAEMSCFKIIKNFENDLYVVTQAYLLLGDIYLTKNDYFNAQATYSSIKENSEFPDLKNIAIERLNLLPKNNSSPKPNSKSNPKLKKKTKNN